VFHSKNTEMTLTCRSSDAHGNPESASVTKSQNGERRNVRPRAMEPERPDLGGMAWTNYWSFIDLKWPASYQNGTRVLLLLFLR
jgi:hypothetical protein